MRSSRRLPTLANPGGLRRIRGNRDERDNLAFPMAWMVDDVINAVLMPEIDWAATWPASPGPCQRGVQQTLLVFRELDNACAWEMNAKRVCQLSVMNWCFAMRLPKRTHTCVKATFDATLSRGALARPERQRMASFGVRPCATFRGLRGPRFPRRPFVTRSSTFRNVVTSLVLCRRCRPMRIRGVSASPRPGPGSS
jgi:hypothetical protein